MNGSLTHDCVELSLRLMLIAVTIAGMPIEQNAYIKHKQHVKLTCFDVLCKFFYKIADSQPHVLPHHWHMRTYHASLTSCEFSSLARSAAAYMCLDRVACSNHVVWMRLLQCVHSTIAQTMWAQTRVLSPLKYPVLILLCGLMICEPSHGGISQQWQHYIKGLVQDFDSAHGKYLGTKD